MSFNVLAPSITGFICVVLLAWGLFSTPRPSHRDHSSDEQNCREDKADLGQSVMKSTQIGSDNEDKTR